MGQVKAGELIDPESGEILSNVESVLTGYGITLRDSNSEFRNFGDVLDEVAGKWDTFGTVAKHAIATAFAGTRNQDKFLILLSQYKNALKYEDIAAGSDGTAQKKFDDAYMSGVEANVNKLKAAYESLSLTVLNSDTVNGILNVGGAITGTIDKFIQFAGLVPTLATGLGMFLGGTNQGFFSNFSFWDPKNRNFLVKKDIEPLRAMNTWLGAERDRTGNDLDVIKRSPGWVEQLNNLETGHMRSIAQNLDGVAESMDRVQTIGQKAGSVLKNFGKALLEGAAYGVAMWAVSKGIEAVANAMQAQSIAAKNLKESQDQYKQTQDDLTSAQNDQIAIKQKLADLDKVESKTVDQQSQTEELRNQNVELTRKIQLLKQQAEIEKNKVADNEKTVLAGLKSPGSDSSYTMSGKKMTPFEYALNEASKAFSVVPVGSENDPYKTQSTFSAANAEIAHYNELLSELSPIKDRIDSGTATQPILDRYKELNTEREAVKKNLLQINEDLSASSDAQALSTIDRATYAMGDYSERVSVFGNTLSSLSSDEQQRNLIALANAGKLTGESLKSMVGVDTLTKLVALTGSTENVLAIIKAIAAESASAATSVTSVGTGLSASFETVKTSVTNLSTQYTALTAAQKQQATDGYLTIDTLNALADAGIEYRDAIEPVASVVEGQTGTYKVNLDTLAKTVEANNQYERGIVELKKASALNEIQTLQNKSATEDLTDAEKEQLATAQERVALYDELSKGLANMSKASTAYKVALETANASADFDYGTGTIFKTITDGLDSGRIATDEFKAAMSFFTDGSFGNNITQKDIPAIQSFVESISDLTQGGAAGLNEATKRMGDLLDADGMFKAGTKLTDVAAKLGKNVGTEFAYSLLKSYEDYGFKINLEQIMTSEDWASVADMMTEQAKPLLDTYSKLSGLYSQDKNNEGVQNQIRNIMNTLSVDDLNKAISDYQTAIDSGKFGGSQLAGLQKQQETLNLLLDEKQAFDSKIQLAVEDNASPVLSEVIGLLAQIHDKTITIKAEFLAGSSLYDDPSPTTATQGIGGRGRVSGNANARGTWGRGSGGRTLVGELGPEIVVDPATNRWYTVGDRGAQFANLPQNAIVFNHLQTQSILSQGRLGSRGKALAGGSAAYNRFKDDSDTTFGSFGHQYMVTSDGGIQEILGSTTPSNGGGTPKSNAADIYKSEIKLLEMQIKLTNDLLNMYEKGTENWFTQQQYIIDNYKRQAVLAQAEYDRLIASGSDINSEEVQSVLQSLVEYRKEIFESSKDYWEAEKDNANTTLEHMKAQAQAVMDLQESYHELTKSIQSEQRSIDSELRIASEAYPNLTASEREAAFSGDDYRQLSNRLAVIAAEAANMQADYMQQIKDVGEESSYELETITAEFKKQYELKLDSYNIAKNELAVLKAKKNLENVQSERSVAMLIGGMWTWVADAEAVADAMRSVTDAQQELADAQSDATFNSEQANISSVINQIDDQINAIDALVYSNDSLAGEVHSLVATIQDQVLAAMSANSTALMSVLPTYAGTSTGLFNTSSLQALLTASLSGSGSVYTPTSSLGVDLSSILGNMGSVKPSIAVSSSPTGDIVSINQLTITGAVASQFIALLRSVAPLG